MLFQRTQCWFTASCCVSQLPVTAAPRDLTSSGPIRHPHSHANTRLQMSSRGEEPKPHMMASPVPLFLCRIPLTTHRSIHAQDHSISCAHCLEHSLLSFSGCSFWSCLNWPPYQGLSSPPSQTSCLFYFCTFYSLPIVCVHICVHTCTCECVRVCSGNQRTLLGSVSLLPLWGSWALTRVPKLGSRSFTHQALSLPSYPPSLVFKTVLQMSDFIPFAVTDPATPSS